MTWIRMDWSAPEDPSHSRLDECQPGLPPASSSILPLSSSGAYQDMACPEFTAHSLFHFDCTLHCRQHCRKRLYIYLCPVEEAVDGQRCTVTASSLAGRRNLSIHLSRTTPAIASKAFAVGGQAASTLHTVAVLQVFQAKFFHNIL